MPSKCSNQLDMEIDMDIINHVACCPWTNNITTINFLLVTVTLLLGIAHTVPCRMAGEGVLATWWSDLSLILRVVLGRRRQDRSSREEQGDLQKEVARLRAEVARLHERAEVDASINLSLKREVAELEVKLAISRQTSAAEGREILRLKDELKQSLVKDVVLVEDDITTEHDNNTATWY